jgi:glycosyltransferase involved in cell wall biosynthesis
MRKTLSVSMITKNEEANLERTLASASWADEIVIVDSGSTDNTESIARKTGAKFFFEEWKGFARQKNSSIDKCTSDWVLSLDADESISPELATSIQKVLERDTTENIFLLHRRNHFLGRWIKHGGYYPDPKLRLFPRGSCTFDERAVHETMRTVRSDVTLAQKTLAGDILHNCYPTLEDYIEHMNRYSTLGAESAIASGKTSSGMAAFKINVLLNPLATFAYNYIFRLGFLDGREGFLLHLYHSTYISWKYAKAWDRTRKTKSS